MLGRFQGAVDLANQALTAARKPIGGWRSQVISKAVATLLRCKRVDAAVDAAKEASGDGRTECVVAVAAALFGDGDQERATALISEELATVRAVAGRSAFYDLACTQLPRHAALFHAWSGSDAGMGQLSQDLAEVERWWVC